MAHSFLTGKEEIRAQPSRGACFRKLLHEVSHMHTWLVVIAAVQNLNLNLFISGGLANFKNPVQKQDSRLGLDM